MKLSWLIIPGLFCFLSCSDPDKKKEQPVTEEPAAVALERDSFPVSRIIPIVACKNNSGISYALYLPHQYAPNIALPALIFTDPHGDGVFPIGKYFSLAEKFGVILIGSNDSKNGIPFTQSTLILQTLSAEATQRFHADERQISLAGFSGGAKATLVAASEIPSLLSVIYCGAGLPGISSMLPPALGITGLKDMNYTEVIQTDHQLDNMKLQHALIEWNGKHEWSDSATFQYVFYWIRFRAMGKKITPVDKTLVQQFSSLNSKPFSNPLQEEMRLMKMTCFLNGVADITSYSSSLESLRKEKRFLAASEKQNSNFELESRMKQNYLQCIELKDLFWWRDELTHMRNTKANPMNDRILGYISLACYSYSNNALKQQNLSAAEKYLAVYSLVDRENPDRAFMQAMLYGYQQNQTGTLQSIQEAINYGFSDRSRLLTEPAFAFTRNDSRFLELSKKIK
ncbi:MAG: hypothetical protein ABI763_14180 [Bacteroidota bacterium]